MILAGAFYVTYRGGPGEHCAPGAACANPGSRKGPKVILWIVTGLVLLLVTFPYYSKYLL